MAYDPNATPPPRRSTGPGTWILVALAVLIIGALIWWFVAGLADDDDDLIDEPAVVDPVEDEDEILDEEPLEDETPEDEGLNRFRPDRKLAFTIDGVGVVIAA